MHSFWPALPQQVSSMRTDGLAIVKRLRGDNRGQDLLEYALLGSLIAIIVLTGVKSFGDEIITVFWKVVVELL